MVKIRLTRTGKKHQPHYRIVAVDSRRPRDGKYLEKIGYYNPRTKPPTLDYDKELLQKWIDNGAQMTDTVHDMFVKEGIIKQSGKRTARLGLITKPEEKEIVEGAETSEEKPQEKKEEEKTDEKTEEKEAPAEDDDKKEKEAPAKKKPEEKLEDKKEEPSEEKPEKSGDPSDADSDK